MLASWERSARRLPIFSPPSPTFSASGGELLLLLAALDSLTEDERSLFRSMAIPLGVSCLNPSPSGEPTRFSLPGPWVRISALPVAKAMWLLWLREGRSSGNDWRLLRVLPLLPTNEESSWLVGMRRSTFETDSWPGTAIPGGPVDVFGLDLWFPANLVFLASRKSCQASSKAMLSLAENGVGGSLSFPVPWLAGGGRGASGSSIGNDEI